jgi:hypothetical protein
VRSFTLVSSEKPTLALPARAYAGFPFIATVGVKGSPAGTAVTVRAQLAIGGQTLTTAERRIQVRRPADAPRTAVRAGAWSGASGVAFRVAGRTVTGFAAQVPLLCPTPGLVGQFTTQIARAAVSRIRLAPDGRFVGATTRSGAASRARGHLRNSRLTGGRVEMSLGGCVGDAAIAATAR